MGKQLYPIKLVVKTDVGNGSVQSQNSKNLLLESTGAITITVEVNREDYPKDKVKETIKETCQRIVEYFC